MITNISRTVLCVCAVAAVPAWAQDRSLCPGTDVLTQYGYPTMQIEEGQIKGMVGRQLDSRNSPQHGDINPNLVVELWGKFCAHPEAGFIGPELEKLRGALAEDMGVSLETEARLHAAMIDAKGWAAQKKATCESAGKPLTKFPGNVKKAVMAGIACEDTLLGQVVQYAWRTMDHEKTTIALPAAVVAFCGVKAPSHFAYTTYRQCTYEAAKVDSAKLPGALAEAKPNQFELMTFLAAYEKGVKELAKAEPEMKKLEEKTPGLKEAVDRVFQVVADKYVPAPGGRRSSTRSSAGPGR
jgi:hypothetical protein